MTMRVRHKQPRSKEQSCQCVARRTRHRHWTDGMHRIPCTSARVASDDVPWGASMHRTLFGSRWSMAWSISCAHGRRSRVREFSNPSADSHSCGRSHGRNMLKLGPTVDRASVRFRSKTISASSNAQTWAVVKRIRPSHSSSESTPMTVGVSSTLAAT